jgi:hypothetical protein
MSGAKKQILISLSSSRLGPIRERLRAADETSAFIADDVSRRRLGCKPRSAGSDDGDMAPPCADPANAWPEVAPVAVPPRPLPKPTRFQDRFALRPPPFAIGYWLLSRHSQPSTLDPPSPSQRDPITQPRVARRALPWDVVARWPGNTESVVSLARADKARTSTRATELPKPFHGAERMPHRLASSRSPMLAAFS